MSQYKAAPALLTFAALMLVPNLSFAYNLKHSASGHVIRWSKNSVELRVDPDIEKMLEPGQVRSAIIMASEAWRGFAGVPDIVIAPGKPPAYNSQQRGNGIYLLRKWPFESRQLAVTVVTYSDTGEVLGADVLVNGEKAFTLYNEAEASEQNDRYDIAAVLTHEFGHVLGLDESFEHPEATMWPQIHQGETHQRVLSVDDQEGVMEAYSAPVAASVPQLHCSVSVPRGNTNGGVALLGLCLLSVLAIGRGRRRAARPVH